MRKTHPDTDIAVRERRMQALSQFDVWIVRIPSPFPDQSKILHMILLYWILIASEFFGQGRQVQTHKTWREVNRLRNSEKSTENFTNFACRGRILAVRPGYPGFSCVKNQPYTVLVFPEDDREIVTCFLSNDYATINSWL